MIARSTSHLTSLCASLVLAAGAALPAAAQDMVTSRPDFTESTATVPAGRMQLEAGYTFARFGSRDTHRIGEALLRFGLIPGLELRGGLPSYITTHEELAGLVTEDRSGFGDANLGIKLRLYEAGLAEGLPSVSLLLGTGIPTGNDDLPQAAGGWEPEAILALAWAFTPRLGLGMNVNYAQRDPGAGDRYDEWAGSVALGFPLTQRLRGFAEYFAIRPDGPAGNGDRDYVDGGLTWLLTPTLQLDARVGVAVARAREVGSGDTVDDDIFFGLGFARLF